MALKSLKTDTLNTVGDVNGLVHIKQETWSGVSSVSINDVFSADYDTYTVILSRCVSASTSAVLQARLRVSGADATGSNYNRQHINATGGTIGGFRGTSMTSMEAFSRAPATDVGFGKIDFFDPFRTVETKFRGLDNEGLGGTSVVYFGYVGNHTLTNSYTGFTFFTNGGQNFSGECNVFGWSRG